MRSNPPRFWLTLALVVLFTAGQFPFFNVVRDKFRFIVGLPARASNSVVIRVKNNLALLGSINDLAGQNARLEAEVNQKNAEIARLKSVENENATLRTDLNFSRAHPEFQLVPANIIGFSPESASQVITIDLGERDGLKLEQAVVAQGFLIGKVKRLSAQTAEVWLLANRNLLTPVRLTGSQTTGILSGGIRGMVVGNIPIDTKIEAGELVVTANLEGLYPAGIAVGQVEEIISRQEEIFLSTRINTPVNIGAINQVFIVSQR